MWEFSGISASVTSLSCQPSVAAHPRLQFMWQASLVLMWQADHRPPPTQARRPPLSPVDPVRQFRPGVPFSGPWIQFPGYGQESRSKVKPAGRSRYLTRQPAATLFDQPLTLSCPVCLALRGLPVCYLSPGGFLIPPSYGFLFRGSKAPAVVAGPRDEATATRTTCHGLWSSPLCLGQPVCSALEAPVLYPVRVCPEGPPPSPVELLRRGSRLPGGGVMSCVSCVPASCVLIWFVSCPCSSVIII